MPALSGKAALISGAAGGIGRAIVLAFAAEGASVACLDLDGAGAEKVAREAGGKSIACTGDVSREADCTAAAKAVHDAFGRLDILVSAAAPNDPGGTILETRIADWERTVAVNLTGSFLLCRAALPAMIASGGGSVILVASQLGRVGSAGRAAYCATKGALIQLAKVLAIDHAGDKIRVNTLSPGAVETDRLLFRYGNMEQARHVMAPKHPIGRLGQPPEIAAAAVFLASDAASFVTGSDLLVDGGYTAI